MLSYRRAGIYDHLPRAEYDWNDPKNAMLRGVAIAERNRDPSAASRLWNAYYLSIGLGWLTYSNTVLFPGFNSQVPPHAV